VSEIRVDAIKTRAGAVPTANDVGLNISGSVIQFKHVNFTNNVSVSSSTFTDITGGTITITPQFVTSKIFVLIDCAVYVSTSGVAYAYCGSKIIRGSSTEVSALNMADGSGPYTYGAAATGFSQFDARHYYTAVDSPNTTSATTYKIQAARYATGSVTYNNGGGSSNIIAMEVAQ
jgi:hypothetical protein